MKIFRPLRLLLKRCSVRRVKTFKCIELKLCHFADFEAYSSHSHTAVDVFIVKLLLLRSHKSMYCNNFFSRLSTRLCLCGMSISDAFKNTDKSQVIWSHAKVELLKCSRTTHANKNGFYKLNAFIFLNTCANWHSINSNLTSSRFI